MQIGKEMAIPSILKIGNGALGKIGGYLKTESLDQVVLFFGNGLIDMFGELVMNSLKEADVMFPDIGHQKADDNNGDKKRNHCSNSQDHKLCPGKCESKFQEF